jgi:predicted GIY-YIG superfamily endonuclease
MTGRSIAMKLERKLKNLTRKKLLDFIKKYNQGVVVGTDIH